MRFTKNGPDVPESLIQAHEDGRVVFFCGAGISYPANLPGFMGLVENLYKEAGEKPDPIEDNAIKRGQLDTALGLLENRHKGGREYVRRNLFKILKPNLSNRDATSFHDSLLILSCSRDGKTKLITTNFDRVFEEIIERDGLHHISRHVAPQLPVPKNRLDGIVYLHGLLPKEENRHIDNIVISSGDFGLAYLKERWASRFVSELFQNFNVCFVGYSLNDPILRYMTDAIAADKLLGESSPEIFAFVGYENNELLDNTNEWKAKNVIPILYESDDTHSNLNKTLKVWANIYKNGIKGKKNIAIEGALFGPQIDSKDEGFNERVLWALRDKSGACAKAFFHHDPPPSVRWLDIFEVKRYSLKDLHLLGIDRNAYKDKDDTAFNFSFIQHPTLTQFAPWTSLVSRGEQGAELSTIMINLSQWLVRFIHKKELLHWIIDNGGILNNFFKNDIQNALKKSGVKKVNTETVTGEYLQEEPGSNSLSDSMRILWDIILNSHNKTQDRQYRLHAWIEQFKQIGLTASLRQALIELLSPKVKLKKPYHSDASNNDRLRNIVDWEIVLACDSPHLWLGELSKLEKWKAASSSMTTELSQLLQFALNLKSYLKEADEKNDGSHIEFPSISDHPQNKDYYEWTALIALTRDSWVELAKHDRIKAKLEACRWNLIPFPLFKRLSYFACTFTDVISPSETINWLLEEDGWWLWSIETKREILRVLATLAKIISDDELKPIEQAILNGPPRHMYNEEISGNEWNSIVESAVWVRLITIEENGGELDEKAKSKLSEIVAKHPEWALSERDQFSSWMYDGNELKRFINTPLRRKDLVGWLKNYRKTSHWEEDDWDERCKKNFTTVICSLYALSLENIWLPDRWRQALNIWHTDEFIYRSWECVSSILLNAKNDFLNDIKQSLGYWYSRAYKAAIKDEKRFLELGNRILDLSYGEIDSDNDIVGSAINHPVGHVAESIVCWLNQLSLGSNEGLPQDAKNILARLADVKNKQYVYGRALLASRAVYLHQVDPEWCEKYVLNNFDWGININEARHAWQGFLWSPLVYYPLLDRIKKSLLDTVDHYDSLGEVKNQYANLITFIALDKQDVFAVSELATVTQNFPITGLESAAKTLELGIQGAGEQYKEYWTNSIEPYWNEIWPKSRDIKSKIISRCIITLCIESKEIFKEVFQQLKPWIQVIDHPDFILEKIYKYRICATFPNESLELIDFIVGDDLMWIGEELERCLHCILDSQPELISDIRFQRLEAISERLKIL